MFTGDINLARSIDVLLIDLNNQTSLGNLTSKKYRFKALLNWLHFSDLEATSIFNVTHGSHWSLLFSFVTGIFKPLYNTCEPNFLHLMQIQVWLSQWHVCYHSCMVSTVHQASNIHCIDKSIGPYYLIFNFILLWQWGCKPLCNPCELQVLRLTLSKIWLAFLYIKSNAQFQNVSLNTGYFLKVWRLNET